MLSPRRASLALALAVLSSATALADVIADPALIALGFIEPRSSITRTFRLVNTGTTPVTIASAVPSCTCTSVDAAGKVIPAQGSIELPITMKVAASTGIKVASITFTFGAGLAPARVDMQGEICFPVRATSIDFVTAARVPFINAFGDPANPQGSVSPPLSGAVTVESVDGAAFRVLSVMGQPTEFVDASDSASTPRTSHEVRYNFEGLACEKIPPFLVIATDHPKAPVIDIRVRHKCSRIAPRIPFAEYRANLGAVVPGSSIPFEFELKQSKGWTVTDVTSSEPRVKVQLIGQQSDADHALVSLVATLDPSLRGVLLFPATMTATDPGGATQRSDFWICLDVREPTQKAGS